MKTKKQVEHFLRKRKYKSEIDFKGISSYCKTEYNIKLHVPSSYSDDPEALDYATFANWFDKGFGAGDAVKWNDSIGLVQEGNVNTVLICLRIDGNTPNFDKITIPVDIITPAGENALNRLYLVLDENGQEFGNPFFVISTKYIPKSCDLVCFHNHKTGQEGYGVVRLADKSSGDIVMYCYVIKGEPVKYSMNEYLGKIDDYSFTTFKPADYQRKALDIELAKVGKTWNRCTCRRTKQQSIRNDGTAKKSCDFSCEFNPLLLIHLVNNRCCTAKRLISEIYWRHRLNRTKAMMVNDL